MASVDNALVARLIPEHDRMRSLMGELRTADPAEPQYDARVMELMREVIHHVADEETGLLPQAERVLGERLGELGARMMKRRIALMAPHAGELTKHKARVTPMTSLVLPALALVAAIALFQHASHPLAGDGLQRDCSGSARSFAAASWAELSQPSTASRRWARTSGFSRSSGGRDAAGRVS